MKGRGNLCDAAQRACLILDGFTESPDNPHSACHGVNPALQAKSFGGRI